MATLTWAIKKDSFRTTTKNNQTDYVVSVECLITGVDGEHTFTISHGCSFDAVGNSFTPFDNLTEAQVIQWVQDKMGSDTIANLQAGFDAHFEKLKNPPPPIVARMAPWG